jgi:hypothetical protein
MTMQIEEAVRLARLVYAEHKAGGALHIMLDDGNLEDDDLAFCAGQVETQAERDCLAAWRALAEEERGGAYVMLHGYHPPADVE